MSWPIDGYVIENINQDNFDSLKTDLSAVIGHSLGVSKAEVLLQIDDNESSRTIDGWKDNPTIVATVDSNTAFDSSIVHAATEIILFVTRFNRAAQRNNNLDVAHVRLTRSTVSGSVSRTGKYV